MRRLLVPLATACLVLSSASSLLADKPKPKPPAQAPDSPQQQNANECAKAEASARYVGYGYTHVVTLKNGCTRAVTCELWTDVDATPRATVHVAPGESAEVVTRRGSPSRDVVASKTCSFR